MVDVVSSHAAGVRRHSREFHVEAEVIVAAGAFEAFPARHAGLDGGAVTGFEVGDFGAGPDDFARAFVAQAVAGLDFEAADAAGVPEVDVGAGVLRENDERLYN